MKKIMVLVISIAFLVSTMGCATKIYRPNVDMTNISQEKYEKDLQRCKDVAGYSDDQLTIFAWGVLFFPPLFFWWDDAAKHNDPGYMNGCMKDKGYTVKEEK